MSDPSVCRLDGRRLVAVTGSDAATHLARLTTLRPEAATDEAAAYGALLTPQGKIVADFLLVRSADGFLLDCPAAAAGELVKRLLMFRLRSDVDAADLGDDRKIVAIWGAPVPAAFPCPTFRDPRHDGLGRRAYPPASMAVAVNAASGDWQANRIALAVPELGIDAPIGESFPHDIAMDCLSGVDFGKGCYVGQEVVSRMRHRGTARRRPLAVLAEAPLAIGAAVVAGERTLATITSAAGKHGIAIARLDKVADAIAGGNPPTVDGAPVRLDLPAWADYGWPDTTAADD